MTLEPDLDIRRHVRLVDDASSDLGIVDKLHAHKDGGVRHRAFSVFMFSLDRRLLLQQRAATKYHWPLVWSNSCCGHPHSKSSVLGDAALRLQQELNVQAIDLTEAGTVEYRFDDSASDLTEWELNHVLFGTIGSTVAPNPDEVAATELVTPQQLREACAGRNMSAWFSTVLDTLLTSEVFLESKFSSEWQPTQGDRQ